MQIMVSIEFSRVNVRISIMNRMQGQWMDETQIGRTDRKLSSFLFSSRVKPIDNPLREGRKGEKRMFLQKLIPSW